MKSFSKLYLIVPIILLFVLSCERDTKMPEKDPDTEFIEYEASQGEIGNGGGSVTITEPNSNISGASVNIPASAVTNVTTISISENISVVAPTDSSAIVVSFMPNGLRFLKPVTISLPYKGESDNPTVYYYNSDSSYLEKLKVIDFDEVNGIVKAETNHFSDFFAGEDGVYADVNMYNVNGKIKCKIRFGGYSRGVKYGLGGVKINWISAISGRIYNALDLIDHGKPLSTPAGIVVASLKVELREDKSFGSKVIEQHLFGIERKEASYGKFYAKIVKKQPSGDLQEIYQTEILDRKGLDIFFSGEGIIVNFSSSLNAGKKYFIKTSWVLSDMVNTGVGIIGSRFTKKYKISTKNESNGMWTLSSMSTFNPDKDNTGIFDKHEIIIAKAGVNTNSVRDITETSAVLGGKVTGDGNATVTERGIYYGTSSNPENSGTKVKMGSGTGSYSKTVTSLQPNTTYYVKAYAVNSKGTAYGALKTFKTLKEVVIPTVTTAPVVSINNQYMSGGTVTNDGGAPVTERGICWSTGASPTINDHKKTAGSGTGTFTTSVDNLESGTKYYVRAYAINSKGIGYGSPISFTTVAAVSLPTVNTGNAASITETSAVLGGKVTGDGNATVTERGVYYGTNSNPENGGVKVIIGTGTGSFSKTVTGLSPNTTYYVKAYAKNSKGTAYGSQISFKTNNQTGLATVILYDITDFDATWFIANGEVTADGGLSVTERGIVYNTSGNPDLNDNKVTRGQGTGTFTFTFTSMNSNTTYYVKSYAINSKGTAFSDEKTVTLPGNLPTVSTISITDITETTATAGGNVTDEGSSAVTERGIYWGTGTNPETTGAKLAIGSGTGVYTATLSGLSSNTTYYTKAYAINSAGEALGSEVSFTTNSGSGGETGTLTDYDGNTYITVKIGSQWWMAENLKVTHYPDGTAIPLVEDKSAWDALGYTDKAYCWYDNSTSNRDTYGGLYTWAAAMNGASSSSSNPSNVQGACPDGWHLPSDEEWKQLEMYLGMSRSEADHYGYRGTNEGSKLAGNSGLWKIGGLKNNAAFGTSGFLALPGGSRYGFGYFYDLGGYALFWSATEYDSSYAWSRGLYYYTSEVYRYYYSKYNGFSVRCTKDN